MEDFERALPPAPSGCGLAEPGVEQPEVTVTAAPVEVAEPAPEPVVEQPELDRSRPWTHPLPEVDAADPLVAAFLNKGGTVTKCPPSRRRAA